MKHWSDSQRGIVFFVLAMAFFAALDTTVKYVSAFIPIVTTLWMRYVFQTLISAGMLMPSRGRALWRVKKLGLVFIRGALMVAALPEAASDPSGFSRTIREPFRRVASAGRSGRRASARPGARKRDCNGALSVGRY
ncbi:MAG: hypothetical protein ACKO3Q_03465, partial [Betaproteobacteria bacterium]